MLKSDVMICIIKDVVVSQQGVIGDLRVVGDPRAAERHCEEEEDDSDMVSLGHSDPDQITPERHSKTKTEQPCSGC